MKRVVYPSHPRDSYPARLLRAFYSAIIPGVGQLVAGVKRRGFILLGIFLVVGLVGIIALTRGTDAILEYAVQPKVLLTLLFVNILLMLVRMFAVIDAWMTAKAGTLPPEKPSGGKLALTGVGLALILLLTVTPHAVAGYYTVVSHSLLTSVFAGEKPSATGTSHGDQGAGGGSETTAAPLHFSSKDRLTILLLGIDEGYGREGARADSINVATVNLKTGDVALFGIPRNMADTPLGPKTAAALKKKTYHDIINSLYAAGSRHPELARDGGDPGAEAVMETASMMLGIPIDYYAVVNLNGLIDMVNAFGGIDINVGKRIRIWTPGLKPGDPEHDYYLEAGAHHFNGVQALDYARSRIDSDDYARMKRQRCVLMAMLHQNGLAKLTLKFPAIASALEKNVQTSIPVSALPQLISMRGDVKTSEMISLGFGPPNYVKDQNADGYNMPDIAAIKSAVDAVISDPDQWIADHSTPGTTSTKPSECYIVED